MQTPWVVGGNIRDQTFKALTLDEKGPTNLGSGPIGQWPYSFLHKSSVKVKKRQIITTTGNWTGCKEEVLVIAELQSEESCSVGGFPWKKLKSEHLQGPWVARTSISSFLVYMWHFWMVWTCGESSLMDSFNCLNLLKSLLKSGHWSLLESCLLKFGLNFIPRF